MTDNPFLDRKKCECNKPPFNNLVISKPHQESNMNKERNSYFETKQNGMTIAFLFPPTTRKEDSVKETTDSEKPHHIVSRNASQAIRCSLHTEEIKNVLTTILPEYLTKGGKTL